MHRVAPLRPRVAFVRSLGDGDRGSMFSFGQLVGIGADAAQRPERAQLVRRFRHIGGGTVRLHHLLTEHKRSMANACSSVLGPSSLVAFIRSVIR